MFEEKDKQFQCSSEFGLYRYDSDNDCYSMKKKSSRYGCHYLVVLLTTVIVLVAICLVTYSYISETKTPPRLEFNDTKNEQQNITLSPKENLTELPTLGPTDYPEPIAMELRNSGRKLDNPRPFIYEIRDPKPIGFQYPTSTEQNYQAVNMNPHRHRAKNIQEIIKLLEQSQDENKLNTSNKRKKKQSRRRGNNVNYLQDPFFPYKPQNPSDINLLATNSFRFAPTVQLETKKSPTINEHYPKYEVPQQEIPLTVTLDVQNNQQYTNKRNKKHKLNYNNLYNQNNYFNQRFQQNRIQPYWNNRPYWNHRQQNENNFIPPHPMIVHLNLYPKKKKKLEKDQRISESNILQNCTDNWKENEKYSQIKNASEFNHLLESVRHSYSNDKVTTNDNEQVFRVKNTVFQLDQPDKMNEYLSNNNNDNVDIQKSIGFTVINPNFSASNSQTFATQWHPIVVDNNNDDYDNRQNDNYDLEVGEANDNMDEDRHEPVTLPLPNDIFQKYFNTKPTPKYSNDWDYDTVQKNPNLVNHRPRFVDGRDE